MLWMENWFADNDGGWKRKVHGVDLVEKTKQEGPEEGASSEKKRFMDSNTEQIFR